MKTELSLISILFFASVSANAIENMPAFEKVFDVISSPKLFRSNNRQVFSELKPFCKPTVKVGQAAYKAGNTECVQEVGSFSFSISADDEGVGFIQASFYGADKCQYAKQQLIKLYGKPTKTSGDCVLDWDLKPLKKNGRQRYVGFEVNRHEDKFYFSIGEEQGDGP